MTGSITEYEVPDEFEPIEFGDEAPDDDYDVTDAELIALAEAGIDDPAVFQ